MNFTGDLTRWRVTRMSFVIEEEKETVWDVSKEAVKVLCFCFVLI